MIIRRIEGDLLLIAQYDHSKLAARIMAAWQADGFAQRPTRARVLEATAEHDWGWHTVDASPRIHPETGAPYEFVNAPLDVRQGVWPRTLEHLAPHDPYVAALVAHHAATVYRRYKGTPDWKAFFPSMEGRRDDLLAMQELSFDTFLEDYAIVGMGDLWSLVFCNGWPEPHSMGTFRVVLHPHAHAREDGGERVPGGWLEITPDPFAGAVVPMDVPARRVPARRYASDAGLREAVRGASLIHLTGIAAGTPPVAG